MSFGQYKIQGTTAQNVGYKVYSAVLTQTSTNAPVATVLQNTLGVDITWAYSGVGEYTASTSSALGISVTTAQCFVNGYNTALSALQYETLFGIDGTDSLYLSTYKLTEQDGGSNLLKTSVNGVIYRTPVMIFYYG